ncbi:MAG TPA: ABC transporter permease [Mycobacteriales bacterium]|nr:ABC transporter permease [Mycobacteriales bacterium]HWA65150.1 ABC transporter permease [Mycobacteriales bacterium]
MTAQTFSGGLEVVPVSSPIGGFAHEVRAVSIVWQREMTRMLGDKARMISTLLQPLLFLFVLGAGLSAAVSGSSGGANFKTFLFPGVLVTGILFTAVFSAISIVWDREFGFMREMLVAPISSSSIVVGKCLGGATIATIQSVLIIALAGAVHVPYRALLMLGLLGVVFITSFTMTAVGLVLAARVKSVQTLMPLVNMMLMPLMFMSGSLYPLGPQSPRWLDLVSRFNPLTYAVASARSLVIHSLAADNPTRHLFFPPTWDGWAVPAWLDVLVVFGVGVTLLTAACLMFARTE